MYIKNKRFISKILLLIMLISYLIPTINSVSYAIGDKENIVEIAKEDEEVDIGNNQLKDKSLEEMKEKEEKENKEDETKSNQVREGVNVTDKDEDKNKGEDKDKDQEIEKPINPEPDKSKLWLNYGDNNIEYKNNNGMELHVIEDETLEEELKLIYSIDIDDLSMIKDSNKKYELDNIQFKLKSEDTVVEIPAVRINNKLKEIEELINNNIVIISKQLESKKIYVFSLENIETIDLNYKKSETKKTLNLKFKHYDNYHKNNNGEKNDDEERLELGFEHNGILSYWVKENQENPKLKLTYEKENEKEKGNIKNIKFEIVDAEGEVLDSYDYNTKQKNYILKKVLFNGEDVVNNQKIGIKELEDIEFELNYKPKEVENNKYGKIELKNNYNNYSETYEFTLKKLDSENKVGLYLANKNIEAPITMENLVEYEITNRIDKPLDEDNLEKSKFYYNDNVLYSYIESEEDLSQKNDDLIKRLLNKDSKDSYIYEYDNRKNDNTNNLTLLNAKSEDSTKKLEFDYAKKHIQINHIENDKIKDSLDIELMPDTKYIYIKPQNGGEITESELEKIKINGEEYIKIDVDTKNVKEVQKININYNETIAPDIEKTIYKVSDVLLKNDASKTRLKGTRERTFTAYNGSIFTVQPIYNHNSNIKSNVKCNGYNLADYKQKIIKIDNDISILGYIDGEDIDLTSNKYIDNLFNEEVKNETIDFTFIDSHYILYREIHRTAFNGNQNGDEYDLELTGNNISKHNILETKYYIVPRGKTISLEPIKFDEKDSSYKLISSKEVTIDTSNSNNPSIIYEGEDNGPIYVGGKTDYILNSRNRYDFVFSYKLTYQESAKINPVKIKLELDFNGEEGKENKSVDLIYPRLKKDNYEALIAVDDWATCYTLYGIDFEFDNDEIEEKITLYDENHNIIEGEVNEGNARDVKFIGITIKNKEEEDKIGDFFPKKNKEDKENKTLSKMKRMFSMNPNNINPIEEENKQKENKITFKYKDKNGTCIIEELRTSSVDIDIRYKGTSDEIEDSYKTLPLYTITSLPGSMAKLRKPDYNPVYKDDGRYVYKYIDYDPGKDNTGVTNGKGKHIEIFDYNKFGKKQSDKKIDADIGSYIKIGSNENLDKELDRYYLNYELVERDLPEDKYKAKEYKYKKELYYIPFSYFEEDINKNQDSELIEKVLDMDESLIKYNNTKEIYPNNKSKYEDKLNILYKLIKEFYLEDLSKVISYYKLKGYDTKILDKYISEDNEDNIEAYIEYIEQLIKDISDENNSSKYPNENLDEPEEEIIKEELIKEQDRLKKFQSLSLVEYLKENKVPIGNSQIRDKVEWSNTNNPSESISWEQPFIKETNFSDEKTSYRLTNETIDIVNKKKIKQTIYSTRRYSNIPLSIERQVMDENKILSFLEDPRKPLKIDSNEKNNNIESNEKNNNSAVVDGVLNEEKIIPIIYIQRDNFSKSIIPENIEDSDSDSDPEEKYTSVTVNHYKVKMKSDGMYETTKDKNDNIESFHTVKYDRLPDYMIGKVFPWRIISFKDYGYKYIPESKISETEINEPITNTEGDFKFTKELEKGENHELNLYYEGEGEIEINKSKINVIGKLKDDNNNVLSTLYTNSYEGIIGSSIYIYPENLENFSEENPGFDDYYLLDEDGNIIDKYEGQFVIYPEEGKVGEYIYYYKKITNPDEKPKRIEISYIDESGNKIGEEDVFVLEIPEEKIEKTFKAKEINGYKERIKSYKFNLSPNKELKILKKDGMEIVTSGDKLSTVQNKVTKEKVLEFKDDEKQALIRFYYDKIDNPTPTPSPDPDSKPPINPGKPEVENKVKFIYDANGGLVDEKDNIRILLDRGTKVKDDKVAYRDGYIFKGWSKVKDEEELFDFTKPINKDTKVYAIWEKDKDKLDKVNHFEYIQGYPDRSVRPENNITREEVSAVFYRLLTEDYKQSIYSLENNFIDLSSKRWSNKHISTLANGGILTGYEDGEFKYERFITRAEVATIASRFENLDQSKHNFTDVKGHWAEEYIASASKKGWVEGYKDGSFRPDEYITRAEFVTLVNRVLNRGVKKENILDGIKEFKDLKDNTWYYEEFIEAINGHTFDRDNEKDRTSEKWLELKEFNMDM